MDWMNGMRCEEGRRLIRNDRGVALLITLLVTALLIALVFEFAYNTRVSLRAAVNFRDSQRAYFLARSGVTIFAKFKALQENTKQGEWTPVPEVSQGDTEVMVKWEDERGKFNINRINTEPEKPWIANLFRHQGIATDIYDIVADAREKRQFKLLSELHASMGDDDYRKVEKYLSVYSDNIINYNMAPETVLISMGFS